MQIEMERFEAWLFSQPQDRQFNYFDTSNCAVCQFLKETRHLNAPRVGGWSWNENEDSPSVDLPEWLRTMLKSAKAYQNEVGSALTIADMQRAFLEHVKPLWAVVA